MDGNDEVKHRTGTRMRTQANNVLTFGLDNFNRAFVFQQEGFALADFLFMHALHQDIEQANYLHETRYTCKGQSINHILALCLKPYKVKPLALSSNSDTSTVHNSV